VSAPVALGTALTPRERQVLTLLAEGLSSIEIGRRLLITANTVKSHLYRMGLRLGCGDRAGMVAVAYRTGLLRIPDAELMRQAHELNERARQRRLELLRAELAGGSGRAA
jgi:DNA-binding CsgD family transcriptional regulator